MDFLFSEFCLMHIFSGGWENLNVSQGCKPLVASSKPMLAGFVPWLRSNTHAPQSALCSAEVFGALPACCAMAACFDSNPGCAQSQAHYAFIKLCSPKVCITLQAAAWSGFSNIKKSGPEMESKNMLLLRLISHAEIRPNATESLVRGK